MHTYLYTYIHIYMYAYLHIYIYTCIQGSAPSASSGSGGYPAARRLLTSVSTPICLCKTLLMQDMSVGGPTLS